MAVLRKRPNMLALAKRLWPNTYFYKEQRDIFHSVEVNDETIVPAGNMLGKDFTAARLIVCYFLTHYPCRIVNTSAKDDHLRVMWGEINEAIRTSVVPLTIDQGGPLKVNHREITRFYRGKPSPICYVKGMVSSMEAIASLQGHHARYTLFVSDESSSVPDAYFTMANGWAKRKLILGNPWPCSNYFYRSVEGDPSSNDPGGDIPDPHNPGRFYRKIIRITAEDSPNVRLALAEIARGMKPSHRELVPGVKTYAEYLKNLQLWDEVQKTVSLHARFYKGKEVYLFPEEQLYRCRQIALNLKDRPRRAKAMGVDAAEGGDDTVWTIVDEFGVIYQKSIKTADTADIPGITIGLIKEYRLEPKNVLFDRGGGGKEHADILRRKGYDVRTVGFGEGATDPHKERKTASVKDPVSVRVDKAESAYVYKNRRAEMYAIASKLVCSDKGFGIPAEYGELIRQLKAMPKKWDSEGRIYLPPKDKPNDNYTGTTIKQLIGRSPDQADSFVLAVFGMQRRPVTIVAGGLS